MMERILIVGHGSIGKRHLRIVRECLPDADIHVLRHQHYTEVPEFADGCFRNLVDACAFLPQAAIIANPAPFHLDSAIALAEIGCHLLVEKPIAVDPAHARELVGNPKFAEARRLLEHHSCRSWLIRITTRQ